MQTRNMPSGIVFKMSPYFLYSGINGQDAQLLQQSVRSLLVWVVRRSNGIYANSLAAVSVIDEPAFVDA
jgi:hypothetical protein